ncbi:MAG: dTDP-4-dehydrorhamnose reductase [Calditrichaceae bacterium]
MKRVLVTGSNGLLGQSLVKFFSKEYEVFGASKGTVDHELDSGIPYYMVDLAHRGQTLNLIEEVKPDVIINAGAFTAVDACETERELCWNSNVKAVENIIEASARFNPALVQISTDYVFDGTNGPYKESDVPNPRGVYARSKFAAENIIKSCSLEYMIVRTQVLYGVDNRGRLNFASWVIDQLAHEKEIRVVGDQVGNPTFTDDVCEGISRLLKGNDFGVFHISGSEIVSRYQFALKIAEIFELDDSLIQKISTEELHQHAPRPMNSSFVLDKLVNRTGWEPHDINSGLMLYKSKIEEEYGRS